MSQINDALKRAQDMQSEKKSSSVPPMLPAESPSNQQSPNWIWPVAVVLFLLLFAGVFFAISSGSRAEKKVIAEPAPVPVVQAAAVPAPAPAPAAPAADTVAVKAPAPARVQGIVFDPVHPYAIVSGKTVHVGDAVNGMLVLAISRDAVTLAGNSQTNQFKVGQR